MFRIKSRKTQNLSRDLRGFDNEFLDKFCVFLLSKDAFCQIIDATETL